MEDYRARDHKKSFLNRLKEHAGKFSPSDHRIAEYLVQSYPSSLLHNASEIAQKVGVNISTVSRFFPKIGYQSIKEARATYRDDLEFIVNSPLDRFQKQKSNPGSGSQAVQKTLEYDYQNIKTTFDGVNDKDIAAFVRQVASAESVYIFAGQKPFALAYYLFIQMNLIRKNVYLIEPGSLPGHFINFKPGDVLILFDFRRYFKGNKNAADFAARHGGTVYSFTDSPLAPSAKHAKMIFTISTNGVSIFDSYTAGFALLNALVAQLIKDTEATTYKRQGKFEELYQQFSTFSSLKNR